MNGEKLNPMSLARTRLGPYAVEELVGGGGFGFLYRVRRDGRTYALKIGRQSLASMGAEDRARDEERLDREIAALKTLHHPNIVRVHAFDRWPDLEGGFPYLVMDYVEGVQLDDWQAENTPSLAKIVHVYEKIALAIGYIHEHGIFLRDLKRQNVVVRADEEPVILDFGIARPRLARDVTRQGMVGSVLHYAPEYVKWSDSAASRHGEAFQWQPATDLHAFGYMLYEAFTGHGPFHEATEGAPDNETTLLLAIKGQVPQRPVEANPKVPPALNALVMRLLEKDPKKRPQSAAEVAAALREASEAAQASGDRAWDEPFDLPAPRIRTEEGRPAAPSDPPEPGASKHGGDAAAAADGHDGAEQGASPLVDVIASHEPASFVPPPRETEAAYVEDEAPAIAKEQSSEKDSLESAFASVKAQVARSAPQRRASPLVLGGAAVAAVLLVAIFAGRGSAPTEGPKTLLSGNEGPSLDTVPTTPFEDRPAPPPASSSSGELGAEKDPLTMDGPDAEAIDAALAREYARPTVLPQARVASARPADREAAAMPVPTSAPPPTEPSWLLRSRRLPVSAARAEGPPRPRGVPFGAHIRAKLLTNLDSRTIGSGPVEAILDVPFLVRGEVALPVRTLAYGSATETNGRFTVRFTRLRLPDDTEVAFEGIALARDDGKPGLAASGRIERPPEQREGVAASIAKGTGNALLDTITGGTPAGVARDAGRTVLNREASPAQAPAGQWALLLDAGVVFDIWVENAF